MEKLENVVLEDAMYTEVGRLIADCAMVTIYGDTDVLVTISGPNAEVVKALFSALEVRLGL